MDPLFHQLAKWGFKPVDSNGHPQLDEPPQEQKPEHDAREITKAILNGDGEVQI